MSATGDGLSDEAREQLGFPPRRQVDVAAELAELRASRAPAVPVGVHDHGAEDGPGLACNESRLPDGSLRGACLGPVGVQPEPAEAHWWWVRHAQAHPECCEGTYLHTDHTPTAVPVVHPEPGDRV